ncbi:ATPase [Phormidesmis priestleyi ULC007]|uniref:ATPase n=1 Tax=Phormidesmis priestleyi ULC007 TaxID=1920490 RepID=A0A2T1D5Y3_9CYAN|nr:SRPBCC family protein [Phormidesmis priestleyi]PSB15898.1 ATPase [Phormidesmis priestleyi ULC007]PZO45664.1 MAG: ATPase [Phormidesmis priestleyi]
MDKPTFVYVTYIATTLDKLWEALTSEAFTQQYWGDGQLQSDWEVGSSVQHINPDGESDWQGEVLQSEPPQRLAYTFQLPNETELQPSRVRFELEQSGTTVKLTLIHDRLDTQSCLNVSRRWTVSLSYLKRLLEIEDGLAWVA